MSDQDIFEDKNTPAVPDKETANQNPEPVANTYDDLLRNIRNPETGEPKYKTLEDALKALAHTQEFIPQLQQENAQYKKDLELSREELAKSAGALEALDRLAQPQAIENATPAPQAPDERAIDELVERALNKRQTQAQQKENKEKVIKQLTEKYGDKAGEQFYAKAEQLGLDRKTMNELAAKSPDAVLAYFGESKAPSVQPNTGTVKSEGIEPPKKQFGPLSAPAKSVMVGATTNDLVEEMRRHRQAVYEKYGITQ